MNESPGASRMIESSGGPSGSIGDDVNVGRFVDGATNYGFPFAKPGTPPANPEHLVIVPDDDRLDPGNGKFKVTIRFRTTQNFGNLIQKGQATTKGGYWKFQMPSGKLQCIFRGADRSIRTASSRRPLNDGTWHKVTCTRTANVVKMKVDGKIATKRFGPTDVIRNSKPMTIGGKLSCNQITVGCDYFTGGIDFVKVQKF